MKRDRRAKIVATLGPASSNKKTITELFYAGVDVFRMNFSHGTHEDHAANYKTIRGLEQEAGRPIGVLQDLQGPKIRTGEIAGGTCALEVGAKVRFDSEPTPGDGKRIPLLHPEVHEAIKPGEFATIDVVFDTNGKYFFQNRLIYIQTNTRKKREVLRFKVFVEPK